MDPYSDQLKQLKQLLPFIQLIQFKQLVQLIQLETIGPELGPNCFQLDQDPIRTHFGPPQTGAHVGQSPSQGGAKIDPLSGSFETIESIKQLHQLRN